MSHRFEILSITKLPEPASRCIMAVHDFLKSRSAYINDECYLLFNESEDEDLEPEYITDPDDAIKQLINWPRMGGLEYCMPDTMVGVYFCGTVAHHVDAVQITIPRSIFIVPDKGVREKYFTLAKELHNLINARRTIFGESLSELGFSWTEETARLDQHIVQICNDIELDLLGTDLRVELGL